MMFVELFMPCRVWSKTVRNKSIIQIISFLCLLDFQIEDTCIENVSYCYLEEFVQCITVLAAIVYDFCKVLIL